MTSINNYQCHYTLIKKMMTSKPEDRLRKNGVKTRKYYKWLRWSMKNIYIQDKKMNPHLNYQTFISSEYS